MGYTQLVQPNTNVVEAPGYCLGMATAVFFGRQYGYETATEAWEASPTKNGSRDMPSVAVPVWFSWVGNVGYGTYDYGHVVVWIPGRGFLSSPSLDVCDWNQAGQQWFSTIEDVERTFGCTYRGFTLDIMPNGTVATITNDPAPAPAPAPQPSGRTYTVVPGDNLWGICERMYGYADWGNVNNVAAVNGIENPALIFPGQILQIP